MSGKKIAVIAEFINNFGGIEKEILNFLSKKRCDVYAGIYDPEKTYPEFKEYKIKTLRKDKLPSVLNSFYLRSKFRRLRLRNYDAYIIFGFHSVAAARNNKPSIWRSTQPLSYLYGWDGSNPEQMQRGFYGNNLIKKFFVRLFLKILKFIDQRDIKDVPIILGNSNNVKKRLSRVYPEKEVRVVYPSVNIHRYKYIKSGNFYLSVCRLSGDKNADKIVSAFQKMPDKKLVVVGKGPQEGKIRKMAEKHSNIEIKGFVEEKELQRLYGECIATIYASEREDFGMGPIESMSAGKPAIAINDAGFKETIINKKTGYLIDSPDPKEIIRGVKFLTKDKAKSMKKDCERRAKLFSNENYFKGIMEAIEDAKKSLDKS